MNQHCFVFFIILVGISYARKQEDLSNRLDCNGNEYSLIKSNYMKYGFAIFRSCSLKNKTIDKALLYTKTLKDMRTQDAWTTEDSVLDIATDTDSLDIIAYLNSHAVFPFQTLNFPVATQQPIHSDVVHFDTLPERGLMTASWVALEDIHPDAGPLQYYPGSHMLGLWDMDEIGSRMEYTSLEYAKPDNVALHYKKYERELQKTIDRMGLKPELAILKKGESFIWAASLLHGGSKLKDPTRTRASQVTDYYMAGAKRFWVPKLSIPQIGHILYKCNIPPCVVTHTKITNCAERRVELFKRRIYVDTSTAQQLFGAHCA